jgi:hypothetical protein
MLALVTFLTLGAGASPAAGPKVPPGRAERL